MRFVVDIDEKKVEEKVVEVLAREIVDGIRKHEFPVFEIKIEGFLAKIFDREYTHVYDIIRDEVDKLFSDEKFIRDVVRSYIIRVLRGEDL